MRSASDNAHKLASVKGRRAASTEATLPGQNATFVRQLGRFIRRFDQRLEAFASQPRHENRVEKRKLCSNPPDKVVARCLGRLRRWWHRSTSKSFRHMCHPISIFDFFTFSHDQAGEQQLIQLLLRQGIGLSILCKQSEQRPANRLRRRSNTLRHCKLKRCTSKCQQVRERESTVHSTSPRIQQQPPHLHVQSASAAICQVSQQLLHFPPSADTTGRRRRRVDDTAQSTPSALRQAAAAPTTSAAAILHVNIYNNIYKI